MSEKTYCARCVLALRGFGPSGFGDDPRPLPFTTKSVSPDATTPVGYQPTGMRPASRSLPFADAVFDVADVRSNTATAFASATYRRVPSFESASAFGVLPSPGPSGGGSTNRATIARRLVSITCTRSV